MNPPGRRRKSHHQKNGDGELKYSRGVWEAGGARGGRGKEDCRGGVGGAAGGRQEAKALLLQVSIPGLLAEGTAGGGDGLLGASQEAALRREESEDTGRRRVIDSESL